MKYGQALSELEQGSRVARAGWNGKGMFLLLVHPEHYMVSQHVCKLLGLDQPVVLLSWIGMKTADNKFVPWLASQTDMLSDDWEVVT